MAISQNKKGGVAVIVATSNTTIQLSDLKVDNENVSSFSITKVFWSTANNITIARGANTLFKLTGSDHWPLDYYNIAFSQDATANLVITIPDAGSTVVMEVHKKSDYVSEYFGAS